jgi:hypothetical protein
MLVELPPENRAQLRPLFDGFPGLHGCLHAALEGTMGRAWTDDAAQPSVARIELDFNFLTGDANSPAAEELVRSIDRGAAYYFAVSNDGWPPLLRRIWGDKLGEHGRVAFQPGAWDRDRLRSYIDALPPDFVLKRIQLSDAVRFTELADSLTYNFASLDAFIERGVGFGIEYEGRFVSGCSSFAMSSHSLEFEIQTHPDFRQRDLASATAAAMILHCIDNNLEPCWDAHNEISAALATKLGFVNPKPYTSYEVRD